VHKLTGESFRNYETTKYPSSAIKNTSTQYNVTSLSLNDVRLLNVVYP